MPTSPTQAPGFKNKVSLDPLVAPPPTPLTMMRQRMFHPKKPLPSIVGTHTPPSAHSNKLQSIITNVREMEGIVAPPTSPEPPSPLLGS